MIQLKNISKRYGKNNAPVLHDVSLQVTPGSILGIVGPSGAGKSTLLRCINLLERPDIGGIHVADQDMQKLTSTDLHHARHKIGMIFQHFNLLSRRTVAQNIALPLILSHVPQTEIDERVNTLLDLTGLSDKKNHYPSQLSGGQKQRVAIARALAHRPHVLLCDEATSALDPQNTQMILALLAELNQKLGLTIILVTHDMSVVKNICARVALLIDGQLVEESSTLDFFLHPQSTWGKQFVNDAFSTRLPDALRSSLRSTPAPHHDKPLLRIAFQGEKATQPLMTTLIRNFGLTLNILQAHLEYIQQQAIGVMVLKVEADPEQKLQAAQQYLETQHTIVDTLGYLPEYATHDQ